MKQQRPSLQSLLMLLNGEKLTDEFEMTQDVICDIMENERLVVPYFMFLDALEDWVWKNTPIFPREKQELEEKH